MAFGRLSPLQVREQALVLWQEIAAAHKTIANRLEAVKGCDSQRITITILPAVPGHASRSEAAKGSIYGNDQQWGSRNCRSQIATPMPTTNHAGPRSSFHGVSVPEKHTAGSSRCCIRIMLNRHEPSSSAQSHGARQKRLFKLGQDISFATLLAPDLTEAAQRRQSFPHAM